MQFPPGATELRMSVYDPFGNLLILDASADLIGGACTYEDSPNGCASFSLTLGKTYEQVEALGYYSARNLVEISSGDDAIQTTITSGATKIYVASKLAYDTSQGHDTGQIALYDGSTLTMLIPVTGVGTDGGGDYITVGTPATTPGNPTTIPAYAAGTIIYRRRYCGIIMLRPRPNQKAPMVTVRGTGLSQRMTEFTCSFALTLGNVDVGTAIYQLISQFSSRFPELTISSANFPATGWTSFDGTYQSVQGSSVIGDLLAAANSSGDEWTLRIGHDRTPRLVKLYTQYGNAYSYYSVLPQGETYFEPRNFLNTDEDCSQLYNSLEVIGDTNPATQQPYAAIVQDSTSISLYGQIDAQPVTNTSCTSNAQCAQYGQALLNQYAVPRSNAQFVVSTRNDVWNIGPMGLGRGDCVLGVQSVIVTNFEGSASNVYGLVSSVVTTVEQAGDTYQTVRFSAIEPNWNEAVKERANALASSLQQNTLTGAGISSYCVSAAAYVSLPTYVGLVVTVPSFLALFAAGSAPIPAGGNSFTLVGNATNWVWLLSNGAWEVNQSATFVSNAILWGIFTASGAQRLTTESGIEITTEAGVHITTENGYVVGFQQMAPVGVVVLSQSQLPSMGPEATAAPILTPGSPTITYPVVGNGTYDAEATFAVDLDLATAPWMVGLALFAVAAGDVVDDPRDFPFGVIPCAQWSGLNVTAIWTGIGAGNSKDLYCAYQDGQGRLSLATKVGTTSANQAGTTALLGVPTTPPNVTSPSLPVSSSSFTYAVNGGGTYDAEIAVTLDSNGTTANNALAEIECVIAPHASAVAYNSLTGWTPIGVNEAVNGSGNYTPAWGGCGVQVAYDVGLRLVGQNGSRSYVTIIGTTTAAQMAQLPFTGVTIDPTTGYIIIADTNVYPTGLQYQLSAAGVGSMLSASWSSKTGSTADSPAIWLFYTSTSGGNGYQAFWFEADGKVYIEKWASGSPTILATSTIAVTRDATNFHNLEFIASETTSGTVNLSAVLDGVLMVQATDSSSPYTSGYVAAQFRDATTTNYIDEKTIAIDLGGSPSSSGIKSQGSIVPSSIPGFGVTVFSPTSPSFASGRLVLIGTTPTNTIQFSDGSSVPLSGSGQTLLSDSAGANGTWYYSIAIVLATLQGIYYLSQTPPTLTQLMAFVADGVLPLTVGQSLTVPAGGNGTTSPSGSITKRYLQ